MAASVTKRPTDSVIEPPPKRRRHSPTTNGLQDILLNGNNSKLAAAYSQNPRSSKNVKVDDSQAVISNGHNSIIPEPAQREIVEISSDSSSSDDDNDEEEETPHVNGVSHADEEDTDKEEENLIVNGHREPSIELGDEDLPTEELTFGERLRYAEYAEPIDVEDALAASVQDPFALARTPNTRNLSVPSATSLSTVLTQALRTNDRELLETCFEMNELESVRSTIERLPSHLVGDLLRRLAERIHKRPGRAGNLMIWVQWSLVSHGGFLAGRQDVVSHLSSLVKVMKERAGGLQHLLQLKGKLDMLAAQQELRRNMAAARNHDDDDQAVIYVEGEESDSSEQEHGMRQDGRRGQNDEADILGVVDYELPVVNGVGKHMDEDSDVVEDVLEEDDDSEEGSDEETSDSDIEGLEVEESDVEEVSGSEEEESRPTSKSKGSKGR